MRTTVRGTLACVILAVGVVVCPVSQLLKDTENVNVILSNLMLAAREEGTVLSLKIYHNTRQG